MKHKPFVLAIMTLSLAIAIATLFTPVRDGLSRVLITQAIPVNIIGALYLARKSIAASITILASTIIALFILSLTCNNTAVNPILFSKQLRSMHNTQYIWGGETKMGIECSGLIRHGIIQHYIKSLDPGDAAYYWMKDSTARNLPTQYAELLSSTNISGKIHEIDHKILITGDIAITNDGLHVLSYLGDGKWIQASPEDLQVTVKHYKESDAWFDKPCVFYRFKQP